eukprot:COSAG06_NODE_63699_length_261_cov_1.277778_1_plen_67_part_01
MVRPFLAQALEPPSPKAVENALELLVTIGAMQGPVRKLAPRMDLFKAAFAPRMDAMRGPARKRPFLG